MDFLTKTILKIKKIKIIIVTGEKRSIVSRNILAALKTKMTVKKISKIPDSLDIFLTNVLIIESDIKEDLKNLEMLLDFSGSVTLVLTDEFSTQESLKVLDDLIYILPIKSSVVLNYDNSNLKKIKSALNYKLFRVGFDQDSDFKITDMNVGKDVTNLKINFKGSIVPIWLSGVLEKEEVYCATSALCVLTILGINILEASENLKKAFK